MAEPTTDLRRYLETARAAARLLEATIQTAGDQPYPPAVLNQLGHAFTAALQATDATPRPASHARQDGAQQCHAQGRPLDAAQRGPAAGTEDVE